MGKAIIITAGGTSEPIDSVRTITNFSTGSLGREICSALLEQRPGDIEKIYYLCSKHSLQPPQSPLVETVFIGGASDLAKKVERLLTERKVDLFIHCMAVSDYTTDYVTTARMLSSEISDKLSAKKTAIPSGELEKFIEETIANNKNSLDHDGKISSNRDNLIIKLKPTPKVISIIKTLSPKTFLVGFKLLDGVSEDELYRVGLELLRKNKCDLVVANDLQDVHGAAHKAMIIGPSGSKLRVGTKKEIADKIISSYFK